MRVLALLAPLFLSVSGCRDGLSPPRASAIRIYLGAAVFDEQTVGVDSVFQLTAQIIDAAGRAVPGENISWSTDRPDVVTVSGSGLVTAKAVGTATITARHRVGEDAARINVAEYVTGPVACTQAEELSLAVGEVRVFEGSAAVSLCLSGHTAGSEYTLVPVNTGRAAGSTLPVNVRGTGLINVTGPPTPNLSPTLSATLEGPRMDDRFHQQIRDVTSRALEPRLRTAIGSTPEPTVRPQYTVGQLVSFNASTAGTDGCSSVSMRHGRVRHVSERAVIVADTLNPSGGFTDADYQEFATFFDQHAWPLVTGTFGLPSDIDGNSRAIVFFTVAVNELPANNNQPQNNGSYVGGFFYNRDLFSKSNCSGSNAAEMFYMMVPDPIGQQEPGGRRAFQLNFVKLKVPTLLVHEFQHLVNDSRRLYVNKAPVWEETWLNEGLSHIAEELMFYRIAPNLDARQNLGPSSFTTNPQREAFSVFQKDNFDRFDRFMQAIDGSSPLGADLLVTRGGVWAFLRYLADQQAGGESGLWSRLVTDTRLAGLENLERALDGDVRPFLRDWAVSLYADDTILPVENRYRTLSWNYRTMFTQGTLLAPRVNTFPLRIFLLTSNTPRAFTLQGGSSGYLRFGTPGGNRSAIRVTVGATTAGPQLPPPARLKVAVLRTK